MRRLENQKWKQTDSNPSLKDPGRFWNVERRNIFVLREPRLGQLTLIFQKSTVLNSPSTAKLWRVGWESDKELRIFWLTSHESHWNPRLKSASVRLTFVNSPTFLIDESTSAIWSLQHISVAFFDNMNRFSTRSSPALRDTWQGASILTSSKCGKVSTWLIMRRILGAREFGRLAESILGQSTLNENDFKEPLDNCRVLRRRSKFAGVSCLISREVTCQKHDRLNETSRSLWRARAERRSKWRMRSFIWVVAPNLDRSTSLWRLGSDKMSCLQLFDTAFDLALETGGREEIRWETSSDGRARVGSLKISSLSVFMSSVWSCRFEEKKMGGRRREGGGGRSSPRANSF